MVLFLKSSVYFNIFRICKFGIQKADLNGLALLVIFRDLGKDLLFVCIIACRLKISYNICKKYA